MEATVLGSWSMKGLRLCWAGDQQLKAGGPSVTMTHCGSVHKGGCGWQVGAPCPHVPGEATEAGGSQQPPSHSLVRGRRQIYGLS